MMESNSDQLFRELSYVVSVTEFIYIFSYQLLISDLFISLSTEPPLEATFICLQSIVLEVWGLVFDLVFFLRQV